MAYPVEVIRRIAEKHGLAGEPELLPKGGMVNEAWRIGDAVLRICREAEGKDEAEREVAVVPLVVEAAIRAPKIIGFDLDPKLTELPYTIYEIAKGELLGYCECEPDQLSATYREIGREIARLGRIQVPAEVRPLLREGRALEPWKTLSKALANELLEPREGKEIAKWIEAIVPKLGSSQSTGLIHMDIHPWNVFVDPARDELTAIIDWGDASWGDPALEFASMPLQAVPEMLEGYREEGGAVDEAFIARTLHAGLSLSLWEIRELPEEDFDRRWWRMPQGGWSEFKGLLARHWPQFEA